MRRCSSPRLGCAAFRRRPLDSQPAPRRGRSRSRTRRRSCIRQACDFARRQAGRLRAGRADSTSRLRGRRAARRDLGGLHAWNPWWSKDGSALYFLSDRSGTSQLWKLSLAGFGEAEQVTDSSRASTARFSPDESRLLLQFTRDALKAAENRNRTMKDAKTRPKPFVITRLEFKEDAGEGYLTGDRAEHLYVSTSRPARLTQLDLRRVHRIRGRLVARRPAASCSRATASRSPMRAIETDLWLVDAGNADKGATLVRLTNDERTKSEPAFSPDGRTIAFLSPRTASTARRRSRSCRDRRRSAGPDRGLDRWVNDFRFPRTASGSTSSTRTSAATQVARVRPSDGKLETGR